MEKSVKITLIIVSAVIFLTLVGIYFVSQTFPTTNTINTNGVATIKAVPDLVGVYFQVSTNGLTAQDARDKNSEIVDTLITNLVKEGLERKQIETQSFSVNPDYSWENGKQIDKGYRAEHSLRVQISTDNLDKISKIIDGGVNSGAMISYINFELSSEKQNDYKIQALKQATEDAKIKAEAIALGLGKDLGRVVSVSDSSFDYYPWRFYGEVASSNLMDAKIAATDIQPGEQNIEARVLVVYKI